MIKTLCYILFLLSITLQDSPIKKFIILVQENHSYDNLLGFMDFPIGNLTGSEYNLEDPSDPNSKKYFVHRGAEFITEPDPPHDFVSVNRQLFGNDNFPRSGNDIEPNNSGFAWTYHKKNGDPQNVMNIYTPDQVPVISTLAKNFKVMDNWFASVPSCTIPNKMFFHTATSMSIDSNCKNRWYCDDGFPLKTKSIYESVQESGRTWKIHYTDWCEPMAVEPLNTYTQNFVYDEDLKELFAQLKNGTLPDYTYIVPHFSYSQHPANDVRLGESLIKSIYDNLRISDYWYDTLFLVTYDEHGGFWDSKSPKVEVINPYPQNPGYPEKFNFDRLGVRVPAIAVSPWLAAGVDSKQYEHSSVAATVKKLFNLKEFLTIRDKNARPFLDESEFLTSVRRDCPLSLPNVNPTFEELPPLYRKNIMHAIPENQATLLGTILVNKNLITKEKLYNIMSSVNTDYQAYQFTKEAMEILGFKSSSAPIEFIYLKQIQ